MPKLQVPFLRPALQEAEANEVVAGGALGMAGQRTEDQVFPGRVRRHLDIQ